MTDTYKLYPDIGPGEEVTLDWKNRDYLMACCDCHLVHRFQFTVDGDNLIIQGWRENARTGALRRYRGIPVKDE